MPDPLFLNKIKFGINNLASKQGKIQQWFINFYVFVFSLLPQ